jgi:dTDP-4-amino-4,6-dideoxygalactose transaminase
VRIFSGFEEKFLPFLAGINWRLKIINNFLSMDIYGQYNIVFNKPYFTGKEVQYIKEAMALLKITGNGLFTQKCQELLEKKYGFKKVLLTTSGTDALEMASLLADIKPGDEVIMPSYTFTSTANAFILRGAKIIFADSEAETPNIDAAKIESLITKKTKAIVPVHYAGAACDMDKIMALAEKYKLFVIEDAAQAIDSFYKGRPLGSIGHLGAFSFHETKNISSGEGGALAINDEKLIRRAEIIWEKGTNRAEFYRGEVNKYGWADIGSSFLPSEITAAFLLAQLEEIDDIQKKRLSIWNRYQENLKTLEENGFLKLPHLPPGATNNAHMYYLLCRNAAERNGLLEYLKGLKILAVFHYLPLHTSLYYADKHDGRKLPHCDSYAETIIRLPLYCDLKRAEVDFISQEIKKYFKV